MRTTGSTKRASVLDAEGASQRRESALADSSQSPRECQTDKRGPSGPVFCLAFLWRMRTTGSTNLRSKFGRRRRLAEARIGARRFESINPLGSAKQINGAHRAPFFVWLSCGGCGRLVRQNAPAFWTCGQLVRQNAPAFWTPKAPRRGENRRLPIRVNPLGSAKQINGAHRASFFVWLSCGGCGQLVRQNAPAFWTPKG
jgi:hypothetical protein